MKYSIIKLSDGKEYKCIFTLASFAEIERKFGSLEAWEKKMNQGTGIGTIAWLISLGLKRFQPEITEEYVENNIAAYDLQRVAEELNKAMNISMPKAQGNAQNGAYAQGKKNKKKY